MSPEQLYEHLKEIADKLGIAVIEQSFKQVGLPVKSGHCRVKGEELFIMDRSLPLIKKNQALTGFLCTQAHENIFMPPAVREILHKKNKKFT
jgi:hypothetical protein